MNLFIDNKKVIFTDEELKCREIGDGEESTVYFYNDYALKLYKSNSPKARLSKEEALFLTKIETERILLPRKIAYEEDKKTMKGYLTSYRQAYNLSFIDNLKINDFIKEIKLIDNDAELLASSGVYVDDFHRGNIVYDGKVNLVDPGSFMVCDDDRDIIKRENKKMVKDFTVYEIIGSLSYKLTSAKKTKAFIRKLEDIDSANLCNFIEETSDSKDTLKKYVKRMVSNL